MIYILQHASYESPGFIIDWLEFNKRDFQYVNLFQNDPLPNAASDDVFIILGGPMNVYEDRLYPWLTSEKKWIGKWIQSGNKVLGICFGAQLIATVLGAKVKRNSALEIGWFPVEIERDQLPEKYQSVFPNSFITCHWHGDTFEIPDGCQLIASSKATQSQGFIYKDHVLALQFHPEMNSKEMDDLIRNDVDNLLSESVFVQRADEMRRYPDNFVENRRIIFRLLDAFLK